MMSLAMMARIARGRRWASMRARGGYAALTDADVKAFTAICGESGVVQDASVVKDYNCDWMRKYNGQGTLVLRPSDTQQVSALLRHCNERRLAVVPQGGNTGLVGGSVPVYDEIVVSMSRMNRVIEVDAPAQILVCEAGCILEALDIELSKSSLTMPLDLGAKGSCMIGGNLATNAGGIRLLRYGPLRANVVGMEFVLPDGRIVDNLVKLRKDNTGFDIKQLMIGSEGTLGIITKVALLVPSRPKVIQLAFLGVESFEMAIAVMKRARAELGEILSALEFQDRPSLELVLRHLHGCLDPLEQPHPFYMLIEASGFCQENDTDRMQAFLSNVIEEGLVIDGTLAQDSGQYSGLWKLRESIAEAMMKEGAVFKYDVSVPLTQMYNVVEAMKARLDNVTDVVQVCGYGHLGDSNLHLNIVAKSYSEDIRERIEPFVYETVSDLRGSISAEHGLGVMKPDYIGFSKSAESIALMQQMKIIFDPKGIMNPYKVLPAMTPLSSIE